MLNNDQKRMPCMPDTWDGTGKQKYIIPVLEIDTYGSVEMTNRVGLVGVTKSSLDTLTTLVLSILAGVFMALGAQLFILVTHTATSNYGINQLVGGVAFTLAMVLIVITGAELFAGNCLVAMSFMARKISGKAFTRNMVITFLGNFIGALAVVLCLYTSGQWMMNNHLLGAKIVLTANDKVNIPFGVVFARGMMGNALLCLGVWMCYCGKSNLDKILSLLWPTSCLMACGFEHCVVNMWLIPMGIILKENRAVLAAAEKIHGGIPDLSNLTPCKGKRKMAENNIPESTQTIDRDVAYSPSQTASVVENKAVIRAGLTVTQTLVLSILAGIYVAMGAQFATFVTSDSALHAGFTSFITGIVFSLGLILVEVAGSELFTGNNLNIVGYLSKKIMTRELFRIWTLVYVGNFIGGLMMVYWMYTAHQWEFFHCMTGAKALLIAHKKVNLSFEEALARGTLCNALVCLNVWLCYSSRSVADKVISTLFAIGGFVASGFEHCVANMYFIPMGVILRKHPDVVAVAERMAGKH